MAEKQKPRFIMCICTGQCPGFTSLNLWELINYVRTELDVEYYFNCLKKTAAE